MRANEFIAEAGVLDYVRALNKGAAKVPGFADMPIAQRAAYLERSRGIKNLADRAYNQFMQDIATAGASNVSTGQGQYGGVDDAEYARKLGAMARQLAGKYFNKDADLDSQEQQRIKTVLDSILNNRDDPKQVKDLFTDLVTAIIAAKASPSDTPDAPKGDTSSRVDPRSIPLNAELTSDDLARLRINSAGAQWNGRTWTFADGTEVTKPRTIDQLNLYWFNTYKVKD